MRTRTSALMGPFPLALSLVLSFGSVAMAQQSQVDRQAMQWLRDIQSDTVQIADHANELRTMSRNPGTYPRASHEFELLRIRDRINDIGELVPRLQEREGAPAWQKEIIDEVASLLAAMAKQTEAAIRIVREVPADPTVAPTADIRGLNSNAYEARLVGIDHYAEHINELIGYADTRTESRRQRERSHSMQSTSE